MPKLLVWMSEIGGLLVSAAKKTLSSALGFLVSTVIVWSPRSRNGRRSYSSSSDRGPLGRASGSGGLVGESPTPPTVMSAPLAVLPSSSPPAAVVWRRPFTSISLYCAGVLQNVADWQL